MAEGIQWRDRASGFFVSSSMKLRIVTQTAGIFVGDVAKDAGSGVIEVAERAAEVAERAGTAVRARWSLLQQTRQQPTQQSHSQETVQERLKSAAASTGTLLKRSFSETKDKVAVGRSKVEEAAKRAIQRSRNILANIERWQKGETEMRVFGVPLEDLVQRQKSSRPIPQIIVSCVDYIVLSGLNTENIFKYNGEQKIVQHLRSSFEEGDNGIQHFISSLQQQGVCIYFMGCLLSESQLCTWASEIAGDKDWNATIPEGTSPIDVAALLKIYFQMLPEPLLTFSVYDGVKVAGGNVRQLSDLLRTIPYANYSTLEYFMALLLKISQKSALNKMDAHSLALVLAPLLLWQQQRRDTCIPQWSAASDAAQDSSPDTRFTMEIYNSCDRASVSNDVSRGPIQKANGGHVHGSTENCANLGDFSIQIPLDGAPGMMDLAIIEAVQCLIEQQDVIFADATEAIWQEWAS